MRPVLFIFYEKSLKGATVAVKVSSSGVRTPSAWDMNLVEYVSSDQRHQNVL
jgi:hypothetical protein